MQSLSHTVHTARVFDYETGITRAYPELHAVNAEKSKDRRVTRLGDLYAPHEREFLIIWDHGVTAYLRLPKAAWQITPADIERAHAGATLLKSAEVR